MKIKRKIDGKEFEFELTNDELWNAYIEKEHQFDIDDVDSFFCGCSDDELRILYKKTREEIKSMYDDIAYEMRRNIDKYDMDWEYARDEAVVSVLIQDKVVCV